jgi:leucyl/phenylalanyl-tRNA--protein transferase
MFTRETNASKIALVHLVEHLRNRNFKLLDTQLMNSHIQQFGAVEIERSEYLAILKEALGVDTSFG